ncbi:MAG: glycosyltransferase [Candidatus Andersenbacteria bacterium]
MSRSLRSMLLVAYYYPPRGGGGVQRTVKFAKYLPAFGVRPVVLTVGAAPRSLVDHSFSVAKDVVRVPYREPGRFLGRLFEYTRLERIAGWIRPAIRQALATVHEQGIELLYSTASPYSNHIVALQVARELGLPWIADFRDLWTGNALYRARTPWIAKHHRTLEATVYREATKIVVTSPSQKKYVIEDFGVAPDKIVVITNGFDSQDFAQSRALAEPTNTTAAASTSSTLEIGYIGSFYGDYRPDDFLLALRFLLQRRPEVLRGVRFRFIGDYDRTSREVLGHPELAHVISVESYLPHDQLQRMRAGLAANLLYLPDQGERIRAMIPQKVFEYLATGKPLFAVLPASDVGDILLQHKAATLAPAGDPLGIAHTLQTFLEQLRAGKAARPQGDFSAFERKNLTAKLARVIEEIA